MRYCSVSFCWSYYCAGFTSSYVSSRNRGTFHNKTGKQERLWECSFCWLGTARSYFIDSVYSIAYELGKTLIRSRRFPNREITAHLSQQDPRDWGEMGKNLRGFGRGILRLFLRGKSEKFFPCLHQLEKKSRHL